MGRLATESLPPIHEYFVVSVLVVLAFAVGYAFMLVDALITFVFTYVYRLCGFCWRQLCKWPLRPVVSWLLKYPFWGRRHSLVMLQRYALSKGYLDSDEWRKVQSLWLKCADRLVKVRYGIEPSDLRGDDWQVLYWTIGFGVPEQARADMMLVASHAMGWAGLSASRIAPVLKNEYFLVFCIFLIVNGLLHHYYVVKRRVDPKISGTLAIRATLRALHQNGQPVEK